MISLKESLISEKKVDNQNYDLNQVIPDFYKTLNRLKVDFDKRMTAAVSKIGSYCDMGVIRFKGEQNSVTLFMMDDLRYTAGKLTQSQIAALNEKVPGYKIFKSGEDHSIMWGDGCWIEPTPGAGSASIRIKPGIEGFEEYLSLLKMFAKRLDEVCKTTLLKVIDTKEFYLYTAMIWLTFCTYWKKDLSMKLVKLIKSLL